jgi:hypothetical protein
MPTDIAGAFAAGNQEPIKKEGFGPLSFRCRFPPSWLSFRPFSGMVLPARSDCESEKQVIDREVHKVTWAQVGHVAEPGRYLFTFGWLMITAADLAVWRQYPDAAFTLVVQPSTEAVEEYRLGAFVL